MPDTLTLLCIPAFVGQIALSLYLFLGRRARSLSLTALWIVCALPITIRALLGADIILALGECALCGALMLRPGNSVRPD